MPLLMIRLLLERFVVPWRIAFAKKSLIGSQSSATDQKFALGICRFANYSDMASLLPSLDKMLLQQYAHCALQGNGAHAQSLCMQL